MKDSIKVSVWVLHMGAPMLNFFLPKVHLYKGVDCAKREGDIINHIYSAHT